MEIERPKSLKIVADMDSIVLRSKPENICIRYFTVPWTCYTNYYHRLKQIAPTVKIGSMKLCIYRDKQNKCTTQTVCV